MRTRSHQSLMLLLAFVFWRGVAAIQNHAADMPLNAHLKRYGSGWECDRGYRENGAACTAVGAGADAVRTCSGRALGAHGASDHERDGCGARVSRHREDGRRRDVGSDGERGQQLTCLGVFSRDARQDDRVETNDPGQTARFLDRGDSHHTDVSPEASLQGASPADVAVDI